MKIIYIILFIKMRWGDEGEERISYLWHNMMSCVCKFDSIQKRGVNRTFMDAYS